MKKSWMVLLLLGFALPAGAQMTVAPYRDNDPFVFCTQGYEITPAMMCWIPLPPYTGGTWMFTGLCDPPNYYGRPWTARDTQALFLYETVCPIAIKPGAWTGPAPSNVVPFVH